MDSHTYSCLWHLCDLLSLNSCINIGVRGEKIVLISLTPSCHFVTPCPPFPPSYAHTASPLCLLLLQPCLACRVLGG